MFRALLDRLITRFERDWKYDAGYLRDMNEVSPWILARFLMIGSLGRGRAAPREALAAAGVTATLAEDCGPCTQIALDMAAGAGVPAPVLRAILAGDVAGMGESASLAQAFARAVLDRDVERADPLREEILRRWGKAGLTDIGLALTTARLYPTVKYALGHGRACSRVTVAGEPAPWRRSARLAA